MGCGASSVPRHVIREDNSRLLGLAPARSIMRKQQGEEDDRRPKKAKKQQQGNDDDVPSADEHMKTRGSIDCGKPGMGPCENPNRFKTVAFTID